MSLSVSVSRLYSNAELLTLTVSSARRNDVEVKGFTDFTGENAEAQLFGDLLGMD
jgi:hypothetical protein